MASWAGIGEAARLWRPFYERAPARGEGKTLTRTIRFLLFFIMAATLTVSAQTPDNHPSDKNPTLGAPDSAAVGVQKGSENPVAQVRLAKSWEYGPFVNWGTGIGDRSNFKFLWVGF
jgi:hypothetical protein